MSSRLTDRLSCCVSVLLRTACLLGVDDACILDRASNIVMMIIGAVTLVPVLAALYTAWVDHRNSRFDERTRLLYVSLHELDAHRAYALGR